MTFNKICGIVLNNNIFISFLSIFETKWFTIEANLDFSWSWGMVVYKVEKSKVLMLLTEAIEFECRLSKSCLEFFKIHMWFIPLREYTISQYFCKPSFIVVKIEVNNLERGLTRSHYRLTRSIVVGHNSTYFVKNTSNAKNKYTEDDIVRMLDFLIDNIFVECGGVIFQQVIGIPMGTNCAPLLADLFLYSYEAEFIQTLIKSGKRHLAKSFCFTFRYIDDVLSINNPTFGDYINIIYPVELEIKDTTDADHHASYLDLLLKYDNFHRLQVKLYDKRDDFNFDIVNFPFLSSNIPQSPAYGVFVSQLIRYSRASSLYEDFIMRSQLLTSKLLKQGFTRNRLIATFKKFYGRHSVLVDRFKVSVTNIIIDLFLETLYHWWLSSVPFYSQSFYRYWRLVTVPSYSQY